jgi:hypothetical protein
MVVVGEDHSRSSCGNRRTLPRMDFVARLSIEELEPVEYGFDGTTLR